MLEKSDDISDVCRNAFFQQVGMKIQIIA